MPSEPLPTLNKFIEDQEYEYVKTVLTVAHGNIKRAANIAGRHWSNFYKKKIRGYGFHPKDFRK